MTTGIIDSILQVVPQTYRRDVMVLAFGAAMGTAWFTFDARVAKAEEAEAVVTNIAIRITAIEQRQAVADTKVTDIQGSASRTEGQVNILVQTLISQNSHGELVPAKPSK